MAITLTYPHSYATIIRNKSAERLEIPWLGRRGIVLNPGDKAAIIGYTPSMPMDLNRYDGKKMITTLHTMIVQNQIEVLSIPGGSNEGDNTTVPMLDSSGNLLPGCRVEN